MEADPTASSKPGCVDADLTEYGLLGHHQPPIEHPGGNLAGHPPGMEVASWKCTNTGKQAPDQDVRMLYEP